MQEGRLSLLVGEGRATYRPVNGSVSYNTSGGQFDGQYGQSGRASYVPMSGQYAAQNAGSQPVAQWNGAGTGGSRPGSVSSDVSSLPDAARTRRKRTTPRGSQVSDHLLAVTNVTNINHAKPTISQNSQYTAFSMYQTCTFYRAL